MVAPVRTVSAPKLISDLVKWEEELAYSREEAALLANNAVIIGTPLGKVSIGAASVAAKTGGNTGNGVFSLDGTTPIIVSAEVGVYAVRCIAAASNSGTFRVFDPKGRALGDVVVGSTFANQIKFAIADGATDFIVGDGFDVTIAAGSGKIKILDPAALDGSAKCEGFSAIVRDPGNADGRIVYIKRTAILADSGIVWPVGFTDAQKAQALADVEPRGVVVRAGL
ncbi:head decoration protein [Methylosinus sp. PW1]|uniref:head decoration protein n=1 Tax=Methylosinus sp. PW1 TaxID=107636 RepID=UPI00068930C8|nr:head decoration protein [Methylosinus sp. PW1]